MNYFNMENKTNSKCCDSEMLDSGQCLCCGANGKDIEELTCEKCGGDIGEKLLGDEIVEKCADCGWINYIFNKYGKQ